jgi:hypothetical protein
VHKRRFFGIVSVVFFASVLALTAILVPNPLIDGFLSRQWSRYTGYPVKLNGACIRPFIYGADLSIKKIAVGDDASQFDNSYLKRLIEEVGQTGSPVLLDSRWVLYPRRGGLSVKLLKGRIGAAPLQGGLFLKGGVIQKFLLRFQIRADSSEPFSRLIDRRFPKSYDGYRVAKLSSSGGQWVLWGASGRVLEARWK